MKRKICTAIVLAAGSGRRMGTKVQKQYLCLGDRPVLYYALKAFQDSGRIDEIILVTGADQIAYCREEIVEKYGLSKVTGIVAGGKERSHSVWNGLLACKKEGYVFIHDGARPFVTEDIIERAYHEVLRHRACVAGMPVKDTIKIADEEGYIAHTPDRDLVWMIQTPQVFETELVYHAYAKYMTDADWNATDDAQVVERMMYEDVRLFPGSYQNIKITTPEDLQIASVFYQNALDNQSEI